MRILLKVFWVWSESFDEAVMSLGKDGVVLVVKPRKFEVKAIIPDGVFRERLDDPWDLEGVGS